MYIKKAVIDRIEGGQAVIIIENGQILHWESANLPPGLKEGDVVIVEIKDAEGVTQDQQVLAKKILNEIFNNVPQE
ncbi:MAG: hypothetical protein A2445_02605 [Candidatus Jacksonbacteria bacterium RIFOXYC2_FULL_44_29]|nr:MAG: hypothetical protein UV19_C0002G0025 [Parcubacteria group bacterium GW2011_GWA2_42_28]KKT55893.1 MAG: hypothetical protein UW45_C0003G0026 [Parcubacteria group bacterium GW2011_GWC2_44_22]OGY74507.1 MAG: hypothetical protein A2240_02860 [Candidatus Jacksonbacteria bacterium RIFOXYA2_FULL_43_12]OGY77416.1 MAG: hypothetical protein A2295_01810 [Candidatus Jacksonbacteria bacterium RIFOXYB2_FULL_44_15]OGY78188.1 MAG: hypothetical protein A2550_06155 [Candidatus Jacksonbacteria bacterium RI